MPTIRDLSELLDAINDSDELALSHPQDSTDPDKRVSMDVVRAYLMAYAQANLDAFIDQEASIRATADANEAAARIQAVTAEAVSRSQADLLEAALREAGDDAEIAARIAAVAAEGTARTAAIQIIDDRVDTLILTSGDSAPEVADARNATPTNNASAVLRDAIAWAAGRIYNVQAYGAAGDGATDDAAAINAAIDAAWAAGGGVVLLPSPTYLIANPILYRPNVTITGRGGGGSGSAEISTQGGITTAGTLITYTGTETAITTAETASVVTNMHLVNFKLKTATGKVGIEWKSCQHCSIDHVVVLGFSDIGFHITGLSLAGWTGSWWNYTRNLVIENGRYEPVGPTNILQGIGIKMTGSDNVLDDVRDPNNCYISALIRYCNVGIHNFGGNGDVFRDCDVTTCKVGYLEGQPTPGARSQNVLSGIRMEEHAYLDAEHTDVDMDYVLFATEIDYTTGASRLLTFTSPSDPMTIGERVVASPSGAYGTIADYQGDYMIVVRVNGGFVAGDTLTNHYWNGTAWVSRGITATLTGVSSCQRQIESIAYDPNGDIITTTASHGFKNGMMIKIINSDEPWLNDRYHRITDVGTRTFKLLGRANSADVGGQAGQVQVVVPGRCNDVGMQHSFGFVRGGTQQVDPHGAIRSPVQWISNTDFSANPYRAGWIRGGPTPLIGVTALARWIDVASIDDHAGGDSHSAQPHIIVTTKEKHGLVTGDTPYLRGYDTTNYNQNWGVVTVTVVDDFTFHFHTSNTFRAAETSGMLWIGDAAAEANVTGGVKLTCNGASNTLGHNVNNFAFFRGKYVTAVAMVKCSTPFAIRCQLSDGVTATPYSHYHSGSGEWERLVVHLDVSSRAQWLSAGVRMDLVGAVAYVSRMALYEGVIY